MILAFSVAPTPPNDAEVPWSPAEQPPSGGAFPYLRYGLPWLSVCGITLAQTPRLMANVAAAITSTSTCISAARRDGF
jgi:hypothetical protein